MVKEIKIFEMFSGYRGASFGLKKANIPFECIGISEIDKYAVQCNNNNFPNVKNYGDCCRVDPKEIPDFDLLTGGFPCQDVSIAGHRDLSKGRTNLYLEILRIAKEKKPKFMLLENVKGLLSMKLDEDSKQQNLLIDKIVRDLKSLDYGVCWKVLNSKDYGIPQNRERVWFVCKLGGWEFMEFRFPEKEELKIFVKDILEKEIDKKYYLNPNQIKRLFENQRHREGMLIGEVSSTLSARDYKDGGKRILTEKNRDIKNAIKLAIQLSKDKDSPIQLDLYHLQYGEIRPLTTYIPQDFNIHRALQSGEPKEILIDARKYKGEIKPREYKNVIPSLMARARTDETPIIINTLTEAQGRQGSSSEFLDTIGRVGRRLTPRECFRLMGFLNDEINLDGLSDTQKYKLAGNGWDINLVSKIFKNIFKEPQTTLEDKK